MTRRIFLPSTNMLAYLLGAPHYKEASVPDWFGVSQIGSNLRHASGTSLVPAPIQAIPLTALSNPRVLGVS